MHPGLRSHCLLGSHRLRGSVVACVLLLVLVLAGCTGSNESDGSLPTTDAPTTTAAPTAESVLAAAGTAMAQIDTVLFAITLQGAEVFIDGDTGIIAFNEAEGRFSAPSSADALVKVTAAGFSTEVGAVAIEGHVWITNPLTGSWEHAPEALTFDPAKIFDTEVGLPVLLDSGFSDAILDAPMPDNQGRFHLTGIVDPDQVSELTGGLVRDVSNVEVWVDAETSLVTEARFAVDTDGGDTSWVLLLTGYGSDVEISPPELG